MGHKDPHRAPGARARRAILDGTWQRDRNASRNHHQPPVRLTAHHPPGPNLSFPLRTMLFTTFLLVTALATVAVLGAMLLSRKPDAEETRVSPALALVAAAAVALTALGIALA